MYVISVNFKVDNKSEIVWINKQTAHNREILNFCKFCIRKKMRVLLHHTLSPKDKIADFELRKIRENLEC